MNSFSWFVCSCETQKGDIVYISAAGRRRASLLIVIQGLLAKHMNRQTDASTESGLNLVATYPFHDYKLPLLGLVNWLKK